MRKKNGSRVQTPEIRVLRLERERENFITGRLNIASVTVDVKKSTTMVWSY